MIKEVEMKIKDNRNPKVFLEDCLKEFEHVRKVLNLEEELTEDEILHLILKHRIRIAHPMAVQ